MPILPAVGTKGCLFYEEDRCFFGTIEFFHTMSASRFFSQNDRFLNKRDPFPEEEAARFLFSCQEVRVLLRMGFPFLSLDRRNADAPRPAVF
jgi:hypothetical protein